MATLHEALAANDGHEVREAIRALVEAIVLVPQDGKLVIEVRGDLGKRRAVPTLTGFGLAGRLSSR